MQEEFVGWTVIKECYVGAKWKMLRMRDDAGKPILFTDYNTARDEQGLLDVIAAETEVSYQALCNSTPVKIPKKKVLAGDYAPIQISPVHRAANPRKIRRLVRGDTWVYLIKAKGLSQIYKIGQSIDIDKRLASLQASSPVKLTVECAIFAGNQPDLETLLHRKFADHRLHGEWFELPVPAVTFIKALADDPDAKEFAEL